MRDNRGSLSISNDPFSIHPIPFSNLKSESSPQILSDCLSASACLIRPNDPELLGSPHRSVSPFPPLSFPDPAKNRSFFSIRNPNVRQDFGSARGEMSNKEDPEALSNDPFSIHPIPFSNLKSESSPQILSDCLSASACLIRPNDPELLGSPHRSVSPFPPLSFPDPAKNRSFFSIRNPNVRQDFGSARGEMSNKEAPEALSNDPFSIHPIPLSHLKSESYPQILSDCLFASACLIRPKVRELSSSLHRPVFPFPP